jgi:hypothetical protein
MRKVGLIAVSCLLLGAWTRGTQVQPSQLEAFKNGVTTADDVKAKLGQPQKSSQKDDGETSLTYVYMEGDSNAARFIPFIRLVAGGTNVHTTKEEFDFDASGHLLATESSQSDMVCVHGACTPAEPAPNAPPATAPSP